MQAGERSGAGPRRRVPPPGAAAPAWADPAAQLKTEMKPGTCGAGGREGAELQRRPEIGARPRGPGEPGLGGGEVPSHSSSINLLWLRSVNKNGVNRPWLLYVWGGSGGQRCRGRRQRPTPARFAAGRSAGFRLAASSSPGAERCPAGPLIGCLHFNSGHCWSN